MPLHKAGTNAFFSNSFLIFITRFFPALANLLVILWYSRQLSTEQYGLYSHFWIQVNISYPLICFGLHILVVTYSKEMLRTLIARLNKIHLLLYSGWALAIGTAFSWLLSDRLGIPIYIPLAFILTFSLSIILESILIVCHNYLVLIPVNILFALAYVWVHWYVLNEGFSLRSVFYCLFIISACRLFVYAVSSIGSFRSISWSETTGNLPGSKEIRSLWMHMGIFDVVQSLSCWADKFVVAMVLSSTVSAIYYNGSMNIPFLPVLLTAAGSSVLIQLARGKKTDERTNAIMLMNQSGRVLSCIVFPVFFFLLMYSHEVIVDLLTVKYAQAVPVFIAYLFVLPIRAYSFTTVLQRMHKGAIINIGAVAEIILALLLIYPLYQWMGLPGVALSFVISTWLQAIFYLVISGRLLQVSPFKLLPFINWGIKLIVFGSLFIGIHYATVLFFTGKIALFLGATAMVITIGIALLVELKLIKQNNVDA